MNLFEPETPDLFAEAEGLPAPVVDPDRARNVAQLAALADLNASEEAGSIFQVMADRTALYEQQIASIGEEQIRRDIAAREQEDRLNAVVNVLEESLVSGDQELTQGSAAAYTAILQEDRESAARYAMERRAVENIQNLAAQGDLTQARVMLSNLENGNALDVIRDNTAKRMILQDVIQRAQVDVENNNWLEHAADFLLGFLPLNSSLSNTGNVDIADGLKNWYDGLLSGQRVRREADALWDMPIEEFSRFVNEDFIRNIDENATLFGYRNDTEALNLLTQLGAETPDAWVTNAFNVVDNIGLLAPVVKPARGAMGIAGSMVRNGARREAAELTAKAALDVINDSAEAAVKTGVKSDELVESLSVRAVSPNPADVRVSIAMDADAALARGQALIRELPELTRTARLNPEEVERAVDTTIKRLERQFEREVKDVYGPPAPSGLTVGSEIPRVTVVLGKKTGGGFASETQANRYLASIGESGSGKAIQDSSGQWFAQLTVNIPETGFYTNLLNVKTPSPARWVLNARNVGDIELADAAQVAGNTRNKLLKTLVEPYSQVFRSLAGAQRDAVAQVLQAGENLGKWFTDEQLDVLWNRRFGRSASPKELEAYQAARDINDIEFALRNDEVYKQKAVRGFQTVSFDTGLGRVDEANAIVDRELKDIPRGRVFDASTGRHYVDESRLTPKLWDRLKGQGYVAITLEQPLKMADGTTIKVFLVKGKDALIEPLKRTQIAYRPGGHRMYQGKYFVKQTVKGVQPDTGKEFLENPNTYIAAETRAEAVYWATRMEAARQAVLRGDDLAVIDEIFKGEAGFPDAKEFVRMLDDPNEAFQKNTKFDVYFDREMPDEYLNNSNILDYVEEESGFNGFLRTNGRMYTGRKGEQLRDYMGEKAPLLDPFETINRSLMNIASLSSFSDYKIQAVERWVKTFGSLIDKTDMPSDASNMRLFLEAPLVKGGNAARDRLLQAAQAQRAIIKRTVGWKTENDLRSEAVGRRFTDFVAGTRVGGLIPEARKNVANWWEDSNPISALRSFAFDLKLGMFNIAQLPLQLSTAVAATTLDPVNGMRGWAMIAPMRFMLGGRSLTKAAFENRLDALVKNGVDKLGGFSGPREFKEFVRSATRSGFFDLGGTHGLMDHYGPSAALDGFASGAQRVREAGRFFFFESERWNRIVAWRIAWDEAVKTGLNTQSPEFIKKLAGRAEEYSFNMSRESQSWWQKGVLSVPTQFWAYNARMLEAMTVGNFTPAQKLRLIAGQSLLYGSAGVPVAAYVSEQLKSSSGNTPGIDTLPGVIDRGLVDAFVYNMTGADVLVGRRFGTGGWLPDLVRDIFGASAYGPSSTADLIGGATFSILGQVGKTLQPVYEYMTAESGDESRPLTRDALMRVAANISTVGNALRAYLVYNYGTYMTNSGSTTVSGLPSQTAWAVALGIQPAEFDELAVMRNYLGNKDKAVKEAAKVITNYRVRMLNQPDQRETLAEEINAFVRMLPPDIRARALQQAHDQVDPSLYASLVERLEREQAREQDGITN